MNISKVGQASVADVEIAVLAAVGVLTSAVGVLTSAAMTSTSAASSLATRPTKPKKYVKRKAADRFENIYTDSEEEANHETQTKTVLSSILRKSHW